MNDVTKPARTSDGIRRDIEDNYPDYPEDEYGYTYDAWDLLTLRETDRHDALLDAPTGELDALDLDELDDFERLAVARAHRRHGDRASFIRVCRTMLETKSRHPAIVYPEVAVFAAREIALDDQPRALAWLEEFDEQTSELMESRILSAVLELVTRESSEALDTIVEEYGDEPEMYYEVAEEFWRQSAAELAHQWVDKAREKAQSVGDRATLIDIELLETRLSETKSGE